ncbi:MAG: sigma-70 family RNA polymerase sigma factor [Raineya sp.]|nr:sigma-70 family RNA polymerase sigma factor [Raineya sp.]MDW8297271.1 sigma-70 family RNA polymerase sigma factor [Raineya sp.]
MRDEEILKRIRKGDETALQYLYKHNYRMILRLIVKNNGTESEAQDIFQDALILFWENVRKPDFTLTSKISTYLYSVCQNLWLKELKKKSRIADKDIPEDTLTDTQSWEREEKIKIMQTCIAKLGELCRKILQYYYFDELSMQDIADKLGLANAESAKSKKYKCKKELDEIIKAHFTTKDLLD